MPKFKVQITETLQKMITVEAENEEKAIHVAENEWKNGKHTLYAENFVCAEFDLWDDEIGDIRRL